MVVFIIPLTVITVCGLVPFTIILPCGRLVQILPSASLVSRPISAVCLHSMCLTAAGRPPSSATGRADQDGDEVANETGEEEAKELRWKDSGDLSSAVKTP